MQDISVGQANIQIFGVGGAGNNMVSWLYKKGIKIMNNLNFKRSESFQMIDYVRDLIV